MLLLWLRWLPPFGAAEAEHIGETAKNSSISGKGTSCGASLPSAADTDTAVAESASAGVRDVEDEGEGVWGRGEAAGAARADVAPPPPPPTAPLLPLLEVRPWRRGDGDAGPLCFCEDCGAGCGCGEGEPEEPAEDVFVRGDAAGCGGASTRHSVCVDGGCVGAVGLPAVVVEEARPPRQRLLWLSLNFLARGLLFGAWRGDPRET